MVLVLAAHSTLQNAQHLIVFSLQLLHWCPESCNQRKDRYAQSSTPTHICTSNHTFVHVLAHLFGCCFVSCRLQVKRAHKLRLGWFAQHFADQVRDCRFALAAYEEIQLGDNGIIEQLWFNLSTCRHQRCIFTIVFAPLLCNFMRLYRVVPSHLFCSWTPPLHQCSTCTTSIRMRWVARTISAAVVPSETDWLFLIQNYQQLRKNLGSFGLPGKRHLQVWVLAGY